MLRHLSGPVVKALLLGFFCCLAASANNAGDQVVNEGLGFALRKVHPQNIEILEKIQGNGAKPPEGYSIYQIRILDPDNGEIKGKTPIVLGDEAIVSASHVDRAKAIKANDTIHISLSKEGGNRLGKATGQMALGKDRIAIVLEGKCIVAPTVQAVLKRNLVISGLKDADEIDRVTKALNEKRKK